MKCSNALNSREKCNSLPSSILIRQNNARGADRYNITLLNQDQPSSILTSIRVLYSLFRLYNLSLTHSRLLYRTKGTRLL